MQTLIDIPEEEITLLDKLSEDRRISREELVRTAISTYFHAQKNARDAAFGLWAHKDIDGLEYQIRMRDEWTRDDFPSGQIGVRVPYTL